MYEPYEERRRFKIDLEKLKGKLKEKVKNIRYSKHAITIIAIVALLCLGGVTGYITYTSKITEISSRITILERQMAACQNNLTSCNSNLQDREDELSGCQITKENCQSDLEGTKSNLETCKNEKDELSSELQVLQGSVGEWESKYSELEEDYKILKSEQEEMECNYAKDYCPNGWSYYFEKNDKIICCTDTTIDSCHPEKPSSEDDIKEITC